MVICSICRAAEREAGDGQAYRSVGRSVGLLLAARFVFHRPVVDGSPGQDDR
jgi:hypothetical protein